MMTYCFFAQVAPVSGLATWFMTILSVVSGIGGLLAVASYFATRREVDDLKARLVKVEDTTTMIRQEIAAAIDRQTGQQERRSTSLHNRLNPVAENLSGIKGSMEAFSTSFNNFTRVMEALITRERETKECPHGNGK